MDNIQLYGPGGASALNVGSWLRKDPGADYGAKDLLQAQFAQTPAVDGGALSFEQAGVRRMSFPLTVGSGAAGLSLTEIETLLRWNARPGGYIDVQPEGIPSTESVRFDILAGRYEADHQTDIGRLARRHGDLKLDVEPYGYWPTWILLASTASVAVPGDMPLTLPASAPIGDAPAHVRMSIAPTCPTQFAAATWMTDMTGWSLAGRPSFRSHWGAGSLTALLSVASLQADQFAPASQSLLISGVNLQLNNLALAGLRIPAALEPAYRGRHRLFAFAKVGPSTGGQWALTADVCADMGFSNLQPLASSLTPATIPPDYTNPNASWYGASWYGGSPNHRILDLGEITLPHTGSGLSQDVQIRVWVLPATDTIGVASPFISLAGLSLLPLDGAAGVMPYGMAYPSLGRLFATTLTPAQLNLDSSNGRALLGGPTGGFPSAIPLGDARHYYRGQLPYAGASTTSLTLVGGQRAVALGGSSPLVYGSRTRAFVSVAYQPRFQFLKGL